MQNGENEKKVSIEDTQSVQPVPDAAAETPVKEPKVQAATNVKVHKKKRKIKKWIILGIILVIIIAVFAWMKLSPKTEKAVAQQTAVAAMGNINKIIEGSGTIEAKEQYNITSLVKGEILADYIEEGQLIEEDQILYQIDASDMDNNIKQAKSSLEKAQMNYDESLKTITNLTVTAPITGVISELYVKEGDAISNGTKIADIINSEKMLLKVDFNAKDAANIFAGQGADVTLENSFTTLNGTVKSVASGSLVNSDGVSVTTVEVEVTNPGALMPGDKAAATIGNYACNAPGTFEYMDSQTVLSKGNGDVYVLNYKKGDKVTKDSVLLKLDSDNTSNSVRQSQLSLEDAQQALQNLYDQLEDYKIKSPIAGKVIQKTSKAGDKLDNSTSNTVMAIIADMSTLKFNINVDELDIKNIQEGQKVTITADAMEGQTFTGYVDNISIVGTSTNGVTSYPVKVVIDNGEETGLIPGMNINAQIIVDSRENVLTVPVSAVNRGNTVYVQKQGGGESEDKNTGKNMPGEEGSTEAEGVSVSSVGGVSGPDETTMETTQKMGGKSDVPEGFTEVKVEIGLSDDTNVEIISGLKEGDVVIVQEVSSNGSMYGSVMMGGTVAISGGPPPQGGGPRG